jgi:hypothetical protein
MVPNRMTGSCDLFEPGDVRLLEDAADREEVYDSALTPNVPCSVERVLLQL